MTLSHIYKSLLSVFFVSLTFGGHILCVTISDRFLISTDTGTQFGHYQQDTFSVSSNLECAGFCTRDRSCRFYGISERSDESQDLGIVLRKKLYECYLVVSSHIGHSYTPDIDVEYREKVSTLQSGQTPYDI